LAGTGCARMGDGEAAADGGGGKTEVKTKRGPEEGRARKKEGPGG